MKGDFSRTTFDPKKHYNAVLMQQGRVQLDADWNEQRAIDRYRIETEARDLIGDSGGRAGSAGFEISVQNSVQNRPTLSIGPGSFYVDGILCRNENSVLFEAQPDMPGASAIGLLPREMEFGLVYLDVWERHVTGLEDGAIREVALGGPDTATRSQTVWQAKVLSVGVPNIGDVQALQPLLQSHVDLASQLASSSGQQAANLRYQLAKTNRSILDLLGVNCDNLSDDLQRANPPSNGQLLARAVPPASAASPCVLPPSAGYERVENQLYRVEIHDGGALGAATFKWSRDNGSVVTPVLGMTQTVTGAEILVPDLGRDETLGFAAGDFVEMVDDSRELFNARPGPLVQITDVDPSRRIITVDETLPNVDAREHPKLRRWDSAGTAAITAGAFVELEGGIEVQFTGNRYNTGDYWLIPARTATGGIEWPENQARPPAGVRHRYAQLAIVMAASVVNPGQPTGPRMRQLLMLADCRRLYPSVTELTSLFYLSGDGQEAGPGQPVPRTLAVGVANGNKPVPGARVRFETQTGGQLVADSGTGTSVTATTDARGEARCGWTLAANPNQFSQQVTASLVDGTHLSVYFNASLTAASEIAAQRIQITRLALGQPPQSGQPPQPGPQDLLLDGRVSVASLANGIHIVCDQNSVIDEQTVVGRPTCFVTLDMPFPQNSADRTMWGTNLLGFQPLILAGQVSVSSDGKRIIWMPTAATSAWLLNSLFQQTSPAVPTELTAHLTLKGNFILDKNRPQTYLDGDAFARKPTAGSGIELGLPSGDGRRGGDLDMWFRLVPPTLQLDAITLNQANVVGGGTQVTVTGTVQISGTAPSAGTTISLTSNNTAAATVPANVTVQAGQVSQTFTVTTKPVASATTVRIEATLTPSSGSSTTRAVDLVVRPPELASVGLAKSSTIGRSETIQGTVTLNGPAPSGGVGVTLTSNSATAKLQPTGGTPPPPAATTTVTVPQGSTTVGFQVTTDPVISILAVTITASAQGSTNQTTSLTVQPPTVSGVTIGSPSVTGGSSSSCSVQLTGAAPSGFNVSLGSSDTTVATVPIEVTVPQNATSQTFTATTQPVSSQRVISITAARLGISSSGALTVRPPVITNFTFTPTTVGSNANSTGRLTLNGPAPSGTSFTLSPTSNSAASFPQSVSVSSGATQPTFTATGLSFSGTSERSVSVTASYLGSTSSATLTVQPKPKDTKEKEKEKEKDTKEGKDTKEKEASADKLAAIEKVASLEKTREVPLAGSPGIAGPRTAEGEPVETDEESGESGGTEEGSAPGRAFVQPEERPDAGERALHQPPDEEEG